ncbi:unnamed protein product [Caenorhabditis angaria]|uniref:Uncharacterized protein n=1 Tax=Caenorhabditis angaria TaxID=860376 RepID=A0A9P1IM92_9PELO|nr:unnamed protein product [Caenorhabditis angaria]
MKVLVSSSILVFLIFLVEFGNSKSENFCRGSIGGECDPIACGGQCSAKYVRFYDNVHHSDRTIKNCMCQQERFCSISGLSAINGCRSYSLLNSAVQRYIRHWSMDSRDRQNRHSNDARFRYSDKLRHMQLINGHSRFCCHSTSPHFALQLRSSSFTLPQLSTALFLIILNL